MTNQQSNAGEYLKCTRQVSSANYSLLAVVIFSLINVVMALFGSETYFLFSASVPHFIAFTGALYCGLLPDYYYTELGISQAELLDPSALVVFGAIAIGVVAIYFILWLVGRKKVGAMTASLVLFCIDTVIMFVLYGISLDMLLDVIFHGWVIVSLVMGISASKKLKQFAKQEQIAQEDQAVVYSGETGEQIEQTTDVFATPKEDSPVLEVADWTVKSRILLEAEAFGHKVCYRRVKRTNQLIIDDNIYAQIDLLMEGAHCLQAIVDGHDFQVGFDGYSKSYAIVDGKLIASKTRLI